MNWFYFICAIISAAVFSWSYTECFFGAVSGNEKPALFTYLVIPSGLSFPIFALLTGLP